MVRKTSRSSALKASDHQRRESPRRTTCSKKSSSEESEKEVISDSQAISSQEQGSSGNESDSDSKMPLKKRTRTKTVTETKNSNSKTTSQSNEPNQRDEEDEVNEDISKGKSKSINITNNEDFIPQTENKNVQVTDESPNDVKDDSPTDDEVSKNGMETSTIDVNISQSLVAEMTCNLDASANENTEAGSVESHSTHKAENREEVMGTPEIGENNDNSNNKSVDTKVKEYLHGEQSQSDKHQESINIVSESTPGTTKKIRLNRLPKDKHIFESKDEKEEEPKRKITLKRPENKPTTTDEKTHKEKDVSSPKELSNEDQWSSLYESNKDYELKPEEKSTRKKITLKRLTVDDSLASDKKESSVLERSKSLQETRERRKSSTFDNIIINERQQRRNLSTEKLTNESEENLQKAKKAPKIVKLMRKMQVEPVPSEQEVHVKKFKWNLSEGAHGYPDVLQLDTLIETFPSIKFLEEEEVDLEVVFKEPKVREHIKRKTFTELEEEEMESIEAELNAEPEEIEVKENIIAMNRKISIVDDTASKLKPPPSPAKNPVSPVLFITNLVRPFTAKQLKELLERTGKIREGGYWTDKIKSKCYVHYETSEEAEATRNALHGVNWPIGNGKKLIIDYGTVEDMENARNPPIVLPKIEKSPEKENKKPLIVEERQNKKDGKTSRRDWDISKEDNHRRRRSQSRSRERREKKHSRRSYTPEDRHKKRKHEEPVPQKAMDELFLKTKATPSIYWQPLPPEEIARKQQQRKARLEENKRKLQEISSRSGRRGVRDRGGRDRNFRRR